MGNSPLETRTLINGSFALCNSGEQKLEPDAYAQMEGLS